mgnify:CR=1 FL=1
MRALDQIIEWRGKPAALRGDNGPEHISQSLVDWANKNRITLMYIQPGKPTQNAYIERFNRTARHEWLDLHAFNSVADLPGFARHLIALKCNSIGDVYDQQAVHRRIQNRSG